MQKKTLYRFSRGDGGTTVSPKKPASECVELYRLIADEGKALTKDGETLHFVVDVESYDGWYEVDAPEKLTDVSSQSDEIELNEESEE